MENLSQTFHYLTHAATVMCMHLIGGIKRFMGLPLSLHLGPTSETHPATRDSRSYLKDPNVPLTCACAGFGPRPLALDGIVGCHEPDSCATATCDFLALTQIINMGLVGLNTRLYPTPNPRHLGIHPRQGLHHRQILGPDPACPVTAQALAAQLFLH